MKCFIIALTSFVAITFAATVASAQENLDPNSDCTYSNGCYICPSPIVINFENGDYRLTGTSSPVFFDIDATNEPRLIGWTAAGADEAFLWLDRNGNGKVDSGAELFGTATPLANGTKAPNGFVALTQFDDNGDRVTDEHDGVWTQLMLWRDLNHDGISQPEEMGPLAESGVTAIYLDYHWTGRRDKFGNVFRYQSKVWIQRPPNGQATARPVYDIFFIPVK